LGYDEQDENKHHGYVTGILNTKKHIKYINWFIFIFTGALIVLSMLGANPVFSLLGITFVLIGGFTYNLGLNKESKYSAITMAISYVGMICWAYGLSNEIINIPIICTLTCYIIFVVIIQISFFGSMKDIESDENNFMQNLGASVDGGWFEKGKSHIIYLIMRICSFVPVIVFFALTFNEHSILFVVLRCILIAIVFTAVIWLSFIIFKSGLWNRKMKFLLMNISEFLVIFFVFPFYLAIWKSVIMIFASILLYVGFNRLIWDSYVQKV